MLRLLSTVLLLCMAAGPVAAADGFRVIDESSGGGAAVQGISATGSVVTGVSNGRVFRWTPDQGLTYISPRDKRSRQVVERAHVAAGEIETSRNLSGTDLTQLGHLPHQRA
jgi:hypothetical protein